MGTGNSLYGKKWNLAKSGYPAVNLARARFDKSGWTRNLVRPYCIWLYCETFDWY